MNKVRLGLGCLGIVLGGGVGLLVGSLGAYAIAELVTPSRETQAYLTLLIIPAVGLAGAVTGAATLALFAGRRAALLGVAVAGWVLLAGVVGLGAFWHHPSRPATFRVRNETTTPFQNLFLGGDFRRSTRLGDLAPGQTSLPAAVDLAEPGTFDAIEGRAGNDYVRHRLPLGAAALPDGNYLWVVRGNEGALTYELVRE